MTDADLDEIEAEALRWKGYGWEVPVALVAELRAARAVLRECEYVGEDVACPVCGRLKKLDDADVHVQGGHFADCALAKVLGVEGW